MKAGALLVTLTAVSGGQASLGAKVISSIAVSKQGIIQEVVGDVLTVKPIRSASEVAANPVPQRERKSNFLQAKDLTADLGEVVEPEGGKAPLVPQHVVEWSEKSDVPVLLQYVFAASWVCMLSSLPFILRALDSRPITKTQIIVGVLSLVVLIGGFMLFTNIILFQSVHFKKIRPLTVVECIYFMAQVITTVGYGDITPAKIRGQVFVGLYVLGALFIISMLISDLASAMLKRAQEYRAKLRAQSGSPDDGRSPRNVHDMIKPEKPSLQPLLISLAVFGVLDICWVIFFSTYPGEGKTVFQAVYMSVITLSSVGFGFFTPLTEGGMIFAAFWMVFGFNALVNCISQFTVLMVKLNQYERFRPAEARKEALQILDHITEGTGEVTEAQFLRFTLLQSKLTSEREINNILKTFRNLQNSEKMTASMTSIEKSLSPKGI